MAQGGARGPRAGLAGGREADPRAARLVHLAAPLVGGAGPARWQATGGEPPGGFLRGSLPLEGSCFSLPSRERQSAGRRTCSICTKWRSRVATNEKIGRDAKFNIDGIGNQSLTNAAYLFADTWRARPANRALTWSSLPLTKRSPGGTRPIASPALWPSPPGCLCSSFLGPYSSSSVVTRARWREATTFGLSCLAVLMISPLAWSHYYVFALPAVLFVLLRLQRQSRPLAACLAAAGFPMLTWMHYVLKPWCGPVGLLGLGTALWFVAVCAIVLFRTGPSNGRLRVPWTPGTQVQGTSYLILNSGGRVAPGNCSPGAPTDPYVPSRAYGSSRHEFATGRYTEWIAIGGGSGYRSSSRYELIPGNGPFAATPREPFPPDAGHHPPESRQSNRVACDSVVGEVTSQLLAQCVVLSRHRLMPVVPTPLRYRLQPPAESTGRCLSFHHRLPSQRPRPEVREPQQVKCPGGFPPICVRLLGAAIGPLERHQSRLVGVDRQSILGKSLGENRQDPAGVLFMGEPHDEVIRVANQERFPLEAWLHFAARTIGPARSAGTDSRVRG